MGNHDVKIKGNKYHCPTRGDKDKLLALVSDARDGKAGAIVRSQGWGAQARKESDGSVRITTSGDGRRTLSARYSRKDIDEFLEEEASGY